jgi:hypothetical protein
MKFAIPRICAQRSRIAEARRGIFRAIAAGAIWHELNQPLLARGTLV